MSKEIVAFFENIAEDASEIHAKRLVPLAECDNGDKRIAKSCCCC